MKYPHLLALAAVACICQQPSFADIRIGAVLSLTGPAASLGIPAKNAVALWPKSLDGQSLDVTVLDDASDPTAAANAARKLTQDKKVDVIIGPSITPTSLAVVQVAGESATPVITLAGSDAIVVPATGAKRWAFKLPPSESVPLKMIFRHMKANGQSKLAIVGVSNAYGQTFIDVARSMAAAEGVEITGVERFAPTDPSFVAQALKLVALKPDAILIAAAGTPAAMPQLELKARNFGGTIYQTQAIADNDFLRIGGKAVDGTLLPVSPLLVAAQLPDSNPVKSVGMEYTRLSDGAYGAGSLTLFGAMAWDALSLVKAALPSALKAAQPGTPEFRLALRNGLEASHEIALTHGVYSMSATDHNGADARSQVMVRIDNGKWRYLAP